MKEHGDYRKPRNTAVRAWGSIFFRDKSGGTHCAGSHSKAVSKAVLLMEEVNQDREYVFNFSAKLMLETLVAPIDI
jgi:hypothetical protein